MRSSVRSLCLVPLLLLSAPAFARDPRTPAWLPDEMPLPLAVHSPSDLEFKRIVEREYLVFNLLAAGKLAYDGGRYAEAADHWESLLQLPDLDRDIDKVVRPLAIDARRKAGEAPRVAAAPPPPPVVEEPEAPKVKAKKTTVDVRGVVSGGGSAGPGGAVITLRRTDGRMPPPVVRTDYEMTQRGKEFVPHILAVPVGATVSFRNDDPIFHDVFTPNGFDLGLYRNGVSRTQTFDKPGATPLYCNIHAHMNAWVVAVDTPWYTTADSTGRFAIRGVVPGQYEVEVWHEGSTKTSKASLAITPGMAQVGLTVGSDRSLKTYPLDKYGKPRQQQLGY